MTEAPRTKRTRKRMILIISIISAGIVFASLGGLALSIQEPDVEPTGVELVGISVSPPYVKFKLYLDVDNPNVVGTDVTSIDADVYLDGAYIGHAYQAVDQYVPANSNTNIWVNFNLEERPKTLFPQKMRVTGTVTLSVFGIEFQHAIDHTEDL